MSSERTNRIKTLLGRSAAVLAVAGTLTAAAPAAAHAAPVRLYVDPGHGGKDPGAVGGAIEKKTNLQISKLVIASAKRQGWSVKSSRTTDRFVPLTQRPRKANAWKADVLVSIHSNSLGKRRAGNMTIYRNPASRRLGNNIMRELKPLTRYGDIGNRKDVRGLAVLRGAKQPAVIVELLSVSSPAEARALRSPAQQRRMAEAIVRGVAAHEKVRYRPPVVKARPKKAVRRTPAPKKDPRARAKGAPRAADPTFTPDASGTVPETMTPATVTPTATLDPMAPATATESPAANEPAPVSALAASPTPRPLPAPAPAAIPAVNRTDAAPAGGLESAGRPVWAFSDLLAWLFG